MTTLQREELDRVAQWYLEGDGHLADWRSLHARLVHYRFEALRDLVQGRRMLELGIADGQMTRFFLDASPHVTAVEAAVGFVDHAKEAFAGEIAEGRLELVHALFEDYRPRDRFPVVVAGLILEHMERPVEMLRLFRGLVAAGGVLLVSVPNALSLHRRVATKMGLLTTPEERNAQDLRLGHQRVYTPQLLRSHLDEAGLELGELRGILLKPLANSQIEQHWTPEMLDGFYELGKELPEMCAEILAVCRVRED